VRWKAVALAAVVIGVPAVASAQHTSGTHSSTRESPAMKNIVQVAIDAGSFDTLVTALQAAGLAETLQGEGPFTVFAPSDVAFAKLPTGTLDSLLEDPAALASVLTFHVVPGRIVAADIVRANGATPRTVNGGSLDVEVRGGKVYVNGAAVVTADVAASNGVIHVLDTVLLPAAAPAAP
jgi:uncharacterized surface protein with fasciclin (FAS1) repeats